MLVLALGVGEEGVEPGFEIVGGGFGKQPGAAEPDLGVRIVGGGVEECRASHAAHLHEFRVGIFPVAVDLAAQFANQLAGLRDFLGRDRQVFRIGGSPNYRCRE